MRELMEMPTPTPQAPANPAADPRRPLLAGIFRALESSGAPWCVVHGYEKFVQEVPTDVDVLLSRELSPTKLAKLLKSHEGELNARVVQWLSDGAQWIVLATKDPVPTILQLHVSYDYELAGRKIFDGAEILESRTEHEDYWIGAPAMEFACVLANRIVKGKLDDHRKERLAGLFEQDIQGCSRQVAHLLDPDGARVVSMAIRTGRWDDVIAQMDLLRSGLLNRKRRTSVIGKWARRVKRWIKPDCGLHVVFLGPDGVGKSTVIDAVKVHLSDAFLRTDYFTFAPSLIPQKFQEEKKTPHQLPPRSYPASLLKAAWWSVCYTVGYQMTVRPAKARGSFVMNHRYLLDAMVDRKRYRYAGPQWLLKAIWAISPKPDVIILLDADPKIIWERKKEVALEETIRQRDEYRALIEPLKFSRIVLASQPIEKVVADVDGIVLDLLARRVAKRFKLEASA
jgi:thymidylate kinase